MSDPFLLLGLSQGANALEVAAAFRSLALKVHPDHNDAPNADEQMRTLIQARDRALECCPPVISLNEFHAQIVASTLGGENLQLGRELAQMINNDRHTPITIRMS